MQKTRRRVTLMVVPWVSSASGESRQRAQQPAEAAAHERDHEDRTQHRHGEDHVVVAAVGLPDAGAGRVHAGRGGAEHDVLRVEHLLEHDPEAERRQREEHARQPDGGDGDDRADRDRDQPGEEHRGQPGDVVVADQVAEGGGTHRGQPELGQRHLTRGPDQQPERQEEDHVEQGDGPRREVHADQVGDEQQHGDEHRSAASRLTRGGARYQACGGGGGGAAPQRQQTGAA